MKNIHYIFFLIVFTVVCSFQAMKNDKLDMTNFDEEKLEKLILNQINAVRKSKRLKELNIDLILSKAATDQANYLKLKKKLTHKQGKKKKSTPIDRTDFYKGNFNYVGENVAFTYFNTSVNSARYNNKTEVITTYSQLANHFFWLWKKSKPHYKNILDKDFRLTSIRFSYDSTSNRIYGVQVFGTK